MFCVPLLQETRPDGCKELRSEETKGKTSLFRLGCDQVGYPLLLMAFYECKSLAGPSNTKAKGSYAMFQPPTTQQKAMTKTYNSRDSLLVTHATTSPPIRSLDMTEQTGSLVFCDLWLYVEERPCLFDCKGGS
jgi:hypothetical protein